MKFDKLICVGNPPYNQASDASGSAKALYNTFIETVIDHLAPDFFTFIVPSRWMVGGKGLDDFRERMMSDRRMKSLTHFQNAEEVFPTVSIPGGVNYFLWEREYWGPCYFTVGNTSALRFLNEHDIVLLDLRAASILKKVEQRHGGRFIYNTYSAKNPFGLSTNFASWQDQGVPCYSRGQNLRYCAADAFTDHHGILNKWKVCTSEAYGDHDGEQRNVIKYTLILPPGAVCTATYIVLHACDTQEEAEHFSSYVHTRFFRFLLSLRVPTQHKSRKSFAWVPELGYDKQWCDAELYEMFGLSVEERSYIEAKIR